MRGPPGGGAGGGAAYDRARAGSAGSGPGPRELGVAFAALAVELGGEAVRRRPDPGRFALAAVGAAFAGGRRAAGMGGLGAWRFASSVTGGRLLAANTVSPFLMVGRRRFMPPIPP